MKPWMSLRSSAASELRPDRGASPETSCPARPKRLRKKLPPSVAAGTCASLSCLTRRHLSVSGRDRLWLAVGDQGMDVLNRQPRIGLIEPDRSAVRACRKINEFLQVF